MDPYKPKDIKHALYKKCNNSAPGEDDIVYSYLKKMTYLHKVLATAFTAVRDKGNAPEDWASSKVILIKKDKDGSDDDLSNFRMISLTFNIGKLYHSLEAQRTIDFMVANKYLDPAAQKAYIEGINGCVEHVTVVQEVIQHAKHNHKTVHITWFDLEDAFGSVAHMLIPIVMNYYNIPTQITTYITSLYSKLQGKIHTQNWESEIFKFLKGVFQGDPFSGVIFLIIFNPIIEWIKKHKETHGYELTTETSAMYVNTTPFADDFNIMSRNSIKHQQIVKDVEEKLKSMGLVLKAPKCRSLSLKGGKTANVPFNLTKTGGPVVIQSVLDKPMKFLGSEVTRDNSQSAMFAVMSSKLESKLQNINRSTLRGEYKLKIYSRYALPSMRYFMSVHYIHKTHMDKLDSLARKYIKIWLKIPKNGVSDVSIFHPYILNVKTPSQMYEEAHASTYSMIRMKGDSCVNHALNSRIEREAAWTKKSSTVCEVKKIYDDNISKNKISEPTTENQAEKRLLIYKAKKAMNKSLKEETLDTWNNKVKKLTFQGEFLNLLIEEETNVTWQSICNNIPKGILSFALKASVNGLNTPDNLKRWGIRKMDKCHICGNYANLEHILNWCSTALDQGRLKWRHDSVLHHMTSEINKVKPEEVTIYTDIPGLTINGGTIPADIITTGQRPDIVIINRKKKKIALLELTVSFEKNIDSANIRKSTRYFDLTKDLKAEGWLADCVPFEIGSRGHVTKKNKSDITNILTNYDIKIKKKKMFEELSKISLLCSFSIFQAHCQPTWQSPPYLHP